MLKIIEHLKRLLRAEYLVLFGTVIALLVARYGYRWYAQSRLWYFLIFFGILVFLVNRPFPENRKLIVIKNSVTSKTFLFLFSMSTIFICFIAYFPIQSWSSYILKIDYPAVFASSKQGWEIIRQGGYFGWSPAFVGGYFTLADLGLNMIHFLLPFSIFGWEVGFHLLLLFILLCFPVLCFFYVAACCKTNEKIALITLPIATIFSLTYFNNLLWWGMIAAFIGVDLTILALIFFERLKEKKRFSFFWLLVTLSFLLYTHPGMCSFCLLYLFIEAASTKKRENIDYLLLVVVLLAAIGFLPLLYRVHYADYLNLDPRNYDRLQIPNLHEWMKAIKINLYKKLIDFSEWQNRYVLLKSPQKYSVLFLPILIYALCRKNWRKQAFFVFISMFITIAAVRQFEHWLSRIEFLLPFFLTVVVTGFLISNEKKRDFTILAITTVTALAVFLPLRHYTIQHGTPGSFYNKPLIDKIKTLTGPYVLVEHNQYSYLFGVKEQIPFGYYWLPLLQMDTGKRFFSNYRGGYHFTSNRDNTFESGFFKNKPIGKYQVTEINTVLSRWGINYLALWSEQSKRFFTLYPRYYSPVWRDANWIIFEYHNTETNKAAANNTAVGEISREDYFSKTIQVENAQEGETIIVRSNYFPAWKAYYKNRLIPLFDVNGQIGFYAPATGNYSIAMKFPRYTAFYLIAAAALLLGAFLSYKKIVP